MCTHIHTWHTIVQTYIPQETLMSLQPFTIYRVAVEARNMFTSNRFPMLFGEQVYFQTTEGGETKLGYMYYLNRFISLPSLPFLPPCFLSPPYPPPSLSLSRFLPLFLPPPSLPPSLPPFIQPQYQTVLVLWMPPILEHVMFSSSWFHWETLHSSVVTLLTRLCTYSTVAVSWSEDQFLMDQLLLLKYRGSPLILTTHLRWACVGYVHTMWIPCEHHVLTMSCVQYMYYCMKFDVGTHVAIKAGSHLFCSHCVATGSVYEMIWTHVMTQE